MTWKQFFIGCALAAGTVAATTGVSAAASVPNGTAPTAPTAPTATSNTKCADERDGAWPWWVQGRPDSFEAGATGGVYMWHDGDGWHIRVTHANDDKTTFTGRLQTSGEFVGVHPIALEHNDLVHVGSGGHVVTFKFENYGHIDGFDFHTSCAPSIFVSLARGTHRLPTDRIFIGDHEVHPAADPFRIHRTDVAG
ncbi:MAG: hypothetical protein ACXV8K_16710 [Ilumatobacteraceae bacterium]